MERRPVRRADFEERMTWIPRAKTVCLVGANNQGIIPLDLVLDPFCGYATACSAAEKSDRKRMGIDTSSRAYDLVKDRLVWEAGIEKWTKGAGLVIHRTDMPV